MTSGAEHVLITGGAGYIGSLLAGELLRRGCRVTVIDSLLFGGNSLLAYLSHPAFAFHKADVCDKKAISGHFAGVDHVVHLAAIVGYPACAKAGEAASYSCNLDGTRNVFELAEEAGARRFVFASTYSNYGVSDDGQPVTEESPLNPQSVYAETKIAAEKYLIEQAARSRCAPVILRFATLFGPSPRTRFDLIINQFVLEAVRTGKLLIYQKDYNRSFVHIRDIVRAISLVLEAPLKKVRGEIFNVGSHGGNYSKDEIARLIQRFVPGLAIEYADLSFDGDMRDVRVAFDKIERTLGYKTQIGIEDGIREMAEILRSGFLKEGGIALKNAGAGD
jgi:nucleoside-diphosphate-sugar epimerase